MRGKHMLGIGVALLTASATIAAPPASQAPSADAMTVPGWMAFTDQLREIAPMALAKLPPAARDNPQVRQEVGRLLLASLAMRAIAEISDDGNHPIFLPTLGQTLSIYQPNADTVYRYAVIAPGGTYRLRGTRGSLRLAKIGEYLRHPSHMSQLSDVRAFGYHDLNALNVDAEGRFDVILSPERPAGYTGDWWPLDRRTGALGIRQVASDWAKERDPTISIEKLDGPAARPRPSAQSLRARLDEMATTTANTAVMLLDHLDELRRQGYVHKFKAWDQLMSSGGLEGQFYYESVYELKDDEALIVESRVPAKCTYYSLILTNEIFETTDWYNNHSSLNDSQSRVDADGVLRIVVSAKDPGVPNWLATADYPTGVIQGRWLGCQSQPLPSIRKIRLSEVRGQLPRDTPVVTPQQRELQIRERRSQLQQRILW